MKLPNEYLDDLLVRMAHHSSSIENNTISLAETVSILLHNTIPNRVSLREFYEVENHRYALDYLLQKTNSDNKISFDILYETYRLLMDRLHHERGQFKSEVNKIIGADFETASPEEAHILMKQWVDNINYRLDLLLSKEEIIELVCESHIEFERIHPFMDGNGRTGRLIMNYLLLSNEVSPLIIEKKKKINIFISLQHKIRKAFQHLHRTKQNKRRRKTHSLVPG